MPASRKRPPVFAIGFTALAVTAIVWFVFFRGQTPQNAQAQTPVAATNEPAPAQPEPKPEPQAKKIPKQSPQPLPPIQAGILQEIRDLAAAGKWTQARAAIGKAFAAEMGDEQREEIATISLQVHEKIFGAAKCEDLEIHEVVTGDVLSKIAKKYKPLHEQYGFLMLLNNMQKPDETLRLGRKMKVPKGTWSIVADKSLFTLWLCYEGAPFRSYKIAIGTEDKTPAAVFTVGNKNPKPAWYPPSEMIADFKKQGVPIPVPYGHAKNPLGEYWIALDHSDYQGFGIHGTNEPKSIGTKASNGCLRMGNDDLMWIAWSTYPGMAVSIVE